MIAYIPSTTEILDTIPYFAEVDTPKKGGFKIFYPARKSDGTREALKLAYIPSFADSEARLRPILRDECERRFEREIDLLSKSTCPYIVKLGGLAPSVVTIAGHGFVAYSEELLLGEDLQVRLQIAPLPNEAELRVLALCLISAIRDLWFNLNTVHRDIKPQNIIKTGNDQRPFVLLDLGLAFSTYDSALTVDPSQRIPGTTRYLAPEMFKASFRESLDYRSDLYTTGVTLYEYASGHHPLARDREDLMETLSRIINVIPEPLENVRKDLSNELTSLVNQLLKKIPALRPSNLDMLRRTLEAGL
jgi:serine/threonine protein kinase